jgi:hypothetical protein
MTVATYDPKRVSVNFAGRFVTGFAEGTFVSVKRVAPRYGEKVGADGAITRVRNASNLVEVKLTLMMTSESNSSLQAQHDLDVNTPGGAGVGALSVVDVNSGKTLLRGGAAWIVDQPEDKRSAEPDTKEWMLHCDADAMDAGGYPTPPA